MVMPVGMAPTMRKGSAQSGAKSFGGSHMATGRNTSMKNVESATIFQSLAYERSSSSERRRLDVKKIAMSRNAP